MGNRTCPAVPLSVSGSICDTRDFERYAESVSGTTFWPRVRTEVDPSDSVLVIQLVVLSLLLPVALAGSTFRMTLTNKSLKRVNAP